jgi:hypothetical protein
LFSSIVLLTIIASTSKAQSIEKLDDNNFHTWKMKMEFCLHEKDLWEITLAKLLPPKVEFGKIVLDGNTLEHHLFTKKDKLICGTILPKCY